MLFKTDKRSNINLTVYKTIPDYKVQYQIDTSESLVQPHVRNGPKRTTVYLLAITHTICSKD